MENIPDPFREARAEDRVLRCPFQGENLPMILRHADVREAAKDWKTFSSDAPFRVPIPSEEEVRSMRQLPIETNPPEHTEYRAIVEPFFQRAKQPEMIAKVEALIVEKLADALGRPSIEIVNDFALPIQTAFHEGFLVPYKFATGITHLVADGTEIQMMENEAPVAGSSRVMRKKP